MEGTSSVPLKLNFIAGRLETYRQWDFKEPDVCTARKMAESGFFLCGSDKEPDLARCFVCLKEMEGWESDDNPAESRYHHTSCPLTSMKKPLSQITLSDVIGLIKKQKRNCLLVQGEARTEEFMQRAAETRKKLLKMSIKRK